MRGFVCGEKGERGLDQASAVFCSRCSVSGAGFGHCGFRGDRAPVAHVDAVRAARRAERPLPERRAALLPARRTSSRRTTSRPARVPRPAPARRSSSSRPTARRSSAAPPDLSTWPHGHPLSAEPHDLQPATPCPARNGSGATYHWEIETDLDVEWAYAMAPRRDIVARVANIRRHGRRRAAPEEALPKYPGAIVSQSFGADETGPGERPDPRRSSIRSTSASCARRHGSRRVGRLRRLERDRARGDGSPPARFTPSAMAAYPASDRSCSRSAARWATRLRTAC